MGLQQELLEDLPTAVYRLYDRTDRLLYVGMTKDPDVRWRAHEWSKLWWHEVVRHELAWYPRRSEAEREESRAIAEEFPRYNVTGAEESEGHGLQRHPHLVQRTTLRAPTGVVRSVQSLLHPQGWTFNGFIEACSLKLIKEGTTFLAELERFRPGERRGGPRKR